MGASSMYCVFSVILCLLWRLKAQVSEAKYYEAKDFALRDYIYL